MMRHRKLDPPRSFPNVLVRCDDTADLKYVADRISKLAGVQQVLIEEHRVTDVWQEPDDGGGGGGRAEEAA
jgi:hypothetical protein